MKTQRLGASLLALALASSALAVQSDPRPKLQKLFSEGTLPKQGELKSIWLGRCYGNDSNEAQGALFIGGDLIDKDGPLFDGENTLKFGISRNSRAEIYDNFHAKDYRAEHGFRVTRAEDSGVTPSGWNDDPFDVGPSRDGTGPAYVKDGAFEQKTSLWDAKEGGGVVSWSWDDCVQQYLPRQAMWRVRKNGKYLVAQGVVVEDVRKLDKGGPLWNKSCTLGTKVLKQASTTLVSCYFYENLL